jgi:DNA-binding MarR family transcriptional regulator
MRQKRLRHFGLALAGEAAWDILLALYQALLAGRALTLQQLCAQSGAYPATIRRWLVVLAGLGLIEQPDAPADPAQQQARLTGKGEQAMADCLRGLLAEDPAERADHLPA